MLLGLERIVALRAVTCDARRCRSRPCRPALRRAAGSGWWRERCSAPLRPPSPRPPAPECSSLSSLTSAISLLAVASSFFALACADLLRRRVAARLRLLELQDRGAAALVDRDQLVGLGRQPAPRQRRVEGVGVFADPADVVHELRKSEFGVISAAPSYPGFDPRDLRCMPSQAGRRSRGPPSRSMAAGSPALAGDGRGDSLLRRAGLGLGRSAAPRLALASTIFTDQIDSS